MRRASIPLAMAALLWLTSSAAHALGFGRLGNATMLGQPLNIATVVNLDADETLTPECVFAEVYSGDNRLPADQIRVTLEPDAATAGQVVRITSSKVIDEPVVTVTVTAGCNGSVSRKFVVFVDPPVVNLAQSAPPEMTAMPPQQLPSQTAPVVAAAAGSAPAVVTAPAAPARVVRRPSPRPPAARGPASTTVAGPATARPRERERTTALVQPKIVAPAASGPRLRLEAAAAPLAAARASEPGALAPQAAASAAAASASEPSRLDEQLALLAKERERLQALEESLKRLRTETQATLGTLATLESRLKVAETSRYANPLVYALASLSALLALASVVLWGRQARARRDARWWTGPGREDAAAGVAQAGKSGPASTLAPPSVAPATVSPPSVATVIEARPAARPASATPPEPAVPQPVPRRELAVEELIDLEQQAEFFIVLGQDEAAIDLLMGHVRSTGGISPLPHLKLLEIYRRRGDRVAYERIRERFNRRFNAYAPDWDSDLQQGRTLEEYAEVVSRLGALWVTPPRAMEYLDASLFRRDATGETFDLPAYRELLLLYSIARDLSESESAANGVDLLLPIGTTAADPAIAGLDVIHDVSGERRAVPRPSELLDLDVSADERVQVDSEGPPSQRGADFTLGSNFLELTDDPPKPSGSGAA
jgi:hypothetical protein